jgi:hypothetical protein
MVKYGENEVPKGAVYEKGPVLNADGTQSKTKNGNPYKAADINIAIPDAPPEGTRWSGAIPVVDKATGEVFTGRIPAKSESYKTEDGSIRWKTAYDYDSNKVLRCAACKAREIKDVRVTDSRDNPNTAVFVPTTAGVKYPKEKFPISITGGPNELLSLAEIKETATIYLDGKTERDHYEPKRDPKTNEEALVLVKAKKRYAVGLPYEEMVKDEVSEDGKKKFKCVTLEMNGEPVNFTVNKGVIVDKDGKVSKASNGIVMSKYTDGGKDAAVVTGYVNGKEMKTFNFNDVQTAFQAQQTEINKIRKEAEANNKQSRFDNMKAMATTSRVTDTPAPAAPAAPAAEKSSELDAPI